MQNYEVASSQYPGYCLSKSLVIDSECFLVSFQKLYI